MRRITTLLIAALAGALTASTASAADFTLAEPFVDGCVLAKEKPIHIFGEGDGVIKLSLAGHKARVRAVDGKWDVVLPAMKAGGPYKMELSCGGKKKILSDIYIGRVILLGGQSNLQFRLASSNTPKEEWETDPLLRSYSLPRLEEGEPYGPADGWVKCTKENAGNWSAIGYLVGEGIRKATGEAVGIINCYQGASVIETWLPREVATQDKYFVPDSLRCGSFSYPPYQAWNKPGTLFDFALAKIVPYSVSDVIWYQGESNTGKGEVAVYQALFGELLKSWRVAFKDNGLPFIVVQLADLIQRNDAGWKGMQKVQAGLPAVYDNVWSVKCNDVCENDDIHPKSKAVLSQRITDIILTEGGK